ncbi:metallophosphoesterase family protein [Mycolicibacterium peregrinum]|uniref:metallophosphoesterase family protein n=1 Tax=Mycolicibacterium peregrinum TaxID=43304 RepID=UPI000A6B6BB8|nr:metallophosphoesterase family protein [Mycolicibacterium peregrinum]
MDYFTADLHLAHPKLADLRGFDTVAAHDAAVMAPLYRLDPKQDTLWVLGDVCAGGVASMESALGQLRTLRVSMHLVTGNHDPVHPMYRGAQKHFAAYAAVFASVQQVARTKVGGEGVMLSHFPYVDVPDRLSRSNFDQYQLPNLGMWLIHGHTHSDAPRSGKTVDLRVAGGVGSAAGIGRGDRRGDAALRPSLNRVEARSAGCHDSAARRQLAVTQGLVDLRE